MKKDYTPRLFSFFIALGLFTSSAWAMKKETFTLGKTYGCPKFVRKPPADKNRFQARAPQPKAAPSTPPKQAFWENQLREYKGKAARLAFSSRNNKEKCQLSEGWVDTRGGLLSVENPYLYPDRSLKPVSEFISLLRPKVLRLTNINEALFSTVEEFQKNEGEILIIRGRKLQAEEWKRAAKCNFKYIGYENSFPKDSDPLPGFYPQCFQGTRTEFVYMGTQPSKETLARLKAMGWVISSRSLSRLSILPKRIPSNFFED